MPSSSLLPGPRPGITALLVAGALIAALTGCGGGGSKGTLQSATPAEPRSTPEAFTHQQLLVEQGARLIVADGCAACHLESAKQRLGPSFESFAGHEATLADGHRSLVDESFLEQGLLHPATHVLRGYSPAPMLAAMQRLHLGTRPRPLSALAAFIEEIGPEAEPEAG